MTGLRFLWEEFVDEPITNHGNPIQQVMEFTEQIVFEENLVEAGFELEEAIAVYIIDADLRMPSKSPKPSPNVLNSTIFLD